MKRLTETRREAIQADYAWQVIVRMSPEQLEDLAYTAIQERLDALSSKELIEFVDQYHPEIIQRHVA
jgi:hypothetical protein